MITLDRQCVFQSHSYSNFQFVFTLRLLMSSLCYITYYLMTGLSGTVNFVSLESRFSANNINCFPRDQSLGVYYFPLECNKYTCLNDNDREKGHQGGVVLWSKVLCSTKGSRSKRRPFKTRFGG